MYTYKYPRPALTVDAIVITPQHQILLIERRYEPFAGRWALPGGFVDIGETLEAASIRELKEETGLELTAMEQFRVFDAIGRDPRHRTISVVFFAIVPHRSDVAGNDDARLAGWFPLTDLPPLAFDHDEIIAQFMQSIKAQK
jgi:8-oxo-dGTP diphosphatase